MRKWTGIVIMAGVIVSLSTMAKNLIANRQSQAAVVSTGGAQSSSAANPPHIIGVCNYVQVDSEGNGQYTISPVVWAQSYSRDVGKNIDWATAVVRLVQPPQHGKLMVPDEYGEWTTEIKDWQETQYISDKNYQGNDSLIMQVEDNGVTIQVHYFLSVNTGSLAPICKGHEYEPWDISAIFPQTPSDNTLYSQNNIPFFGYQLKNVNVSLNTASLPDDKFGKTTGTSVTLDDNGGGYG